MPKVRAGCKGFGGVQDEGEAVWRGDGRGGGVGQARV